MLVEFGLCNYLTTKDVINLSLVCMSPLWRDLSSIISSSCLFRYLIYFTFFSSFVFQYNRQYKQYHYYSPRRMMGVTQVDNLPVSLTHLSFCDTFQGPAINLPQLTHLTFGIIFNSSVSSLPNSITHLTFGDYFNQPIYSLPSSLTHLFLGILFQQELDCLPLSLLSLQFSSESAFDKPLNLLPPRLTHLYLGRMFNSSLDSLPHSLTHLYLGTESYISYFNTPIDFLPRNLKHLEFGKHSFFYQKVSHLPLKVSFIKFGRCFNQNVDCLPPNLTHLVFGRFFNQPINNLPSSIVYLVLGNTWSLLLFLMLILV